MPVSTARTKKTGRMPASLMPYFAAATTILVWAGAFPAIGIAVGELDPVPLAAVRFAVASLPMLVWLLWRRPGLPASRDLWRFAASAALGIASYNILLNTGQQTVSAGAASFLIKFESLVTAVLAVALLGQRFGLKAWLGMFICVLGAGLIAASQPGGLTFGSGAILVLGAAASSGLAFIFQRTLVTTYGAATTAAINIVLGAVILSPWLSTGLTQAAAASNEAVIAVLFLGLVPGAIGYFAWMATLNHFGAGRAANLLYLIPPVAVLIAFLITGEVPGWLTLAGGAAILTGVVLVNSRQRARKSQVCEESATG